MTNTSMLTSATLLVRLKDIDDQAAWDRFYEFYSPLILGYCKRRGCAPEMAYDVLQEIMVTLMRIFPKFNYKPERGHFRTFLLKIVDHRMIDAFRREKWYQSLSSDTDLDWVERLEDPGTNRPFEEWDKLWDCNLLNRALVRIKKKVNSLTYRSFQMYVLERNSADSIAIQLKINKNAVFQHKNRVIKMLQQEVNRLKEEFGE